MDEFALIARYLRPLAAPEGLDLRDDAAFLTLPPGQQLVITKDAIVQGVHFIGDESPALIARKLLRVNLSDLAAKGAQPYRYFLALMLPATCEEAWIADFCAGLAADQTEYGITLAGGDTTATPGPLTLSLTALGLVPEGQGLTRRGAKAGDDIWVSGTLGDGALGLKARRGELEGMIPHESIAYLAERYLLPRPCLALGKALRNLATACMDISDGLAQDAGHIAEASGVKLVMEAQALPFSSAARQAIAAQPEAALLPFNGGDDYELLFTAPASHRATIAALSPRLGIALTRIGTVTPGEGAVMLDDQRQPMCFTQKGYRHF